MGRLSSLRTLTVVALVAVWFFPGAGARAAQRPSDLVRAAAPVAKVAALTPGGAPGTSAEAARYAEREQQQASALAEFEAGSRISTTTIIIILLLVIIILILL
jgi:hypothetical protein